MRPGVRSRARLPHEAPVDPGALLGDPHSPGDQALRPAPRQVQGRGRLAPAPIQGHPMADLEIRNLHVRTEDREILRGVNLSVNRGEIHALMGPNGSGKSTLANTIMGHPAYEVTDGAIYFRGQDITTAEPHERAQAGLFLAFQYPVALPGVSVANLLRLALNAQRHAPTA